VCLLLASGCLGPQLGRQQVRRAEVVFSCTPRDAEVDLDGVPQGRCDDFEGRPRGLLVAGFGAHEVVVRKSGYQPYRSWVAAGDAQIRLTVRLSPSTEQEKEP
jgi:hypothetical protein